MGLKLHEKQKLGWKLLTEPNKTRILFDGGSRSGKTALIIEYLVKRAFQFPGSRQLIARKYRAHAKTSIWADTVKRYLTGNIPHKFYKLQETELFAVFHNGSQIVIGGLDDAERTEKILGNEYITVFLNEATQLSWETVQMAMTRLAQRINDAKGRVAVPKLILDCNPRGPRHWLHYIGVRHVDPATEEPLRDAERWARLNWSAYDNKSHLPPEYLAALESLPELMRDRMLNGVWRSNEGAVYSEFDEDLHVVDSFNIPDEWRRLRAIDFGYTNPFVCLWGALDPDGRLYVYREHYKASMRTGEHAKEILRLSESERYFISVADHDAADRAELESCGIRTEAATKEVLSGIQAVKRRLAPQGDGKPRIYFFKELRKLLSEIYDYRWETRREGVNAREEPVKLNDHAMDALRYMVMALDKASMKEFKSATSPRRGDGRWG